MHRDYINRITLGHVSVINFLSDVVCVMERQQLPLSVQLFQRNLSHFLKLVSLENELWQELFSARFSLVTHLLNEYRNIDFIPIILR